MKSSWTRYNLLKLLHDVQLNEQKPMRRIPLEEQLL